MNWTYRKSFFGYHEWRAEAVRQLRSSEVSYVATITSDTSGGETCDWDVSRNGWSWKRGHAPTLAKAKKAASAVLPQSAKPVKS